MRFDLVDLQLFIAVADARSITHGAERAHLALASASARIKGLEAGLGVALLKRGRRGIELTAAGESLLDHARIIMHNVDAMRGDLLAFSRGMKATVRLLANTVGPVGISAEGAGRLSGRTSRTFQHRRRGARKHRHCTRHCNRCGGPRPRIRIRPAGQHRANSVQRRPPGYRHVAPRRTGAAAAGRFSRSGRSATSSA